MDLTSSRLNDIKQSIFCHSSILAVPEVNLGDFFVSKRKHSIEKNLVLESVQADFMEEINYEGCLQVRFPVR